MTKAQTDRIPQVDSKDEIPNDKRHNYDRIYDSRNRVRGPFPVLLNSPELAGKIGSVGAYLRFSGELPGRIRELAILTTASELECVYEWAAHEPIAKREGLSDDTIECLESRSTVEGLDSLEESVILFGREIFEDHEVSNTTYNTVKDNFGNSEMVELVTVFGYYSMLASVLNAFEVMPMNYRE